MGPSDDDTSSVGTTPEAFGTISEPHLQSHARLQPVAEDGDPFVSQPATTPVRSPEPDATPRRTMSRLLKGKEKEWSSLIERKGPLELLDLPVDILREIINQLPHTNDLTSLALCHSVLHSLTVPCIYSRFDIVWPDSQAQSEPRTGVDALTYGLSTLCMSQEVFGEAAWQSKERPSKRQQSPSEFSNPYALKPRRRGNNYAQFTKKFSLGNGPLDYVQDYNIAREGGKMLGTLVALAVARMRNLETFVWDMPTGVLRDVWLALSSLADCADPQDCKLERVWIRWHDNSSEGLGQVPPPPALPPLNSQADGHQSLPLHLQAQQATVIGQVSQFLTMQQSLERVEHPSFSVLPPLKSLSVLDIDELPYLDELSILIARSHQKLRELRIGVATQAESSDWSQVWEGESLQQVDYSSMSTLTSKIGSSRLGGVLGVLVGRIYNMRNNARTVVASTSPSKSTDEIRPLRPSMTSIDGFVQSTYVQSESSVQPLATLAIPSSSSPTVDSSQHPPIHATTVETSTQPQSTVKSSDGPVTPTTPKSIPLRTLRPCTRDARLRGPYLDGQLRLETLELERVPLSVTIMQRAFDWSILTSLTLLSCPNHDQLWKSLRHLYSPHRPSKSQHTGVAITSSPYSPSPRRISSTSPQPGDYQLKLKKIHTNTASMSLVNFIKDTLAPNSLEIFFLQDGRSGMSASQVVSIETIYRGVIKRHRGSLKKLLIDSSDPRTTAVVEYSSTTSSRWRRWILNREILAFMTSGKMPHLRELSFAIDYKDWHYFLQQMPFLPHIRSLHLTHIADHPHGHGSNIDPRELALQIVDIVTLRSEIELCYLGIANKCFEILENKSVDGRFDGLNGTDSSSLGYATVPGNEPLILDGEDEDEVDANEDNDPEDADDDDDGLVHLDGSGANSVASDSDVEDFAGEDDSDGEDPDDGDGTGNRGPKLRLREILFYDDKVAIFRARHGRL